MKIIVAFCVLLFSLYVDYYYYFISYSLSIRGRHVLKVFPYFGSFWVSVPEPT